MRESARELEERMTKENSIGQDSARDDIREKGLSSIRGVFFHNS